MMKTELKVFISHSHREAEVGAAIKDLLVAAVKDLKKEQVRLTSNRESGLRIGAIINQQLIEDILEAPVFISILSPAYISSKYCTFEYGAALAAEKTPFIFILPGTDPQDLRGVFGGRHVAEITDKSALVDFLNRVGEETDWNLRILDPDEFKVLCGMTIEAGDNLDTLRERLIPEATPTFLNAYGLRDELGKGPIYQNFDCDSNIRNIEAVQFLWADSRTGNTIRAKLEREQEDNCLRVEFDNKGGGGCNISIRPQDECALLRNQYRRLVIDARVGRGGEEASLEAVGVGLRLVNGYMQHWKLHKSQENPDIREVKSKDFDKPLVVDLEDGEWVLFDADGTVKRGPTEKPDLGIISSINLSLGAYKKYQGSPGSGKGVLEIKEIRFE